MATANAAGPYRPRRPERTVLYRVLAQHFERFVQVYDERFVATHGPLTQGAQEAVYRYLDCGIFECGFARVRCGECGHDFFVAFSCKLRCICTSCHAKRGHCQVNLAAAGSRQSGVSRSSVLGGHRFGPDGKGAPSKRPVVRRSQSVPT